MLNKEQLARLQNPITPEDSIWCHILEETLNGGNVTTSYFASNRYTIPTLEALINNFKEYGVTLELDFSFKCYYIMVHSSWV